MITINATGDTTLHTAGKYCEEDILVKVPAGESGGGGDTSIATCTVRLSLMDFMFNRCNGTIYYTFLDSTGVIDSATARPDDEGSGVSADNVLIGSIVYIVMDSAVNSISFRGEGELLYSSSDKTIFAIRVDEPHPGIGQFLISPSDM